MVYTIPFATSLLVLLVSLMINEELTQNSRIKMMDVGHVKSLSWSFITRFYVNTNFVCRSSIPFDAELDEMLLCM
jgi:hypothetical protein